MLMQFENLGRVGKMPDSHLGNMDEAVLLYSDVHEGSESRDIGDDARELHAVNKVVDRVNLVGEFKFRGALARVAARLPEFIDDVGDSGEAEIPADISLGIDLGAEFSIADKFARSSLAETPRSEAILSTMW